MSRLIRIAPAVLATILVAVPAMAQQVTLRLHHFIGAAAPTHKNFLAPWSEKIAQETGGALKIELYPAMGLGGTPPQLFDQAKDGIVDIVWTLPAYTPGRFPRTETFEMPFVHEDPVVTTLALQDFYAKHLQEEYQDVHVLLLHVHAGQVFHLKKPVRSAADFKGLTIRAPGHSGTLLLEELGANAYQSPVPEIPQLLSRGVIDGAMVPYEIVPPLKIQENVKYHVTIEGPRVHTSVFLLAMNKQSYRKLSDPLRSVLDANSREHLARFAGEVWVKVEGPGEDLSRKQGNEFVTLSAAETAKVREAGERAIQRWIATVKGKDIDGAALIADARALLAKYKAQN